ncbi:uncharacterized protein QO010_002313 [Caulobacter ginsengisoli]|uniref:DUF418 domain-containing protein n=1 Tax=Caulobacter ginsengisoli TaxID=400775 RepID=A0ABU0IR93_9CAUL|nr:DUF418 domain-containing protein [Caulobacter ginsengisoli]MDQ0464532.1 uncharacterized protein [Caulobacter ginsengisoli]
MQTAKPERIASLDVMRGVAILGILLINIPVMGFSVAYFADPRLLGWSPADQAVWTYVFQLLDGAERGLLQLLFGASALLLTREAMSPDAPVKSVDTYSRRSLWLIVLGLIHGTLLLWPGDILFLYGLTGLFLPAFRRLKPRTLAVMGFVGLALLGATELPNYLHGREVQAQIVQLDSRPAATPTAADKAIRAEWAEMNGRREALKAGMGAERAQRLGGYGDNLGWATGTWALLNVSPFLYLSFVEAICTMWIGMALFGWGVLQGRRSRRFYLVMMAAGYGLGVSVKLLLARQAIADGFGPVSAGHMLSDVGRLGVAFGHVGLICLAVKSQAGRWLAAPFAAAGRMALTCYVGQSLICCWLLFPGFGLGLWGRFGWAGLETIALGVIAFQLVFCPVWLRLFKMGPLEWLWRRLSYGRTPPVATQAAL